ncbi:DUF3267 domain-containing protein [Telluribacter sp. SYSU D00476]|uniref:DUF3267 domain-containing protein n=1 Tax=Telluribacter sp. SYSU D00476 TaxID=2811430 RepID=UPI001FF11314|nr:DUF3267 domain-containing protein [Telluribacter sp. SYSU D00476]
MIKPSIQDLYESDRYRLVESFSIDEMAEFLAREAHTSRLSRTQSRRSKGYGLVLILMASIGVGGVIGWLVGTMLKAGEFIMSPLWQVALAFVLFFAVVLPVHEAIHALVFKYLGARKVGFGHSLKSLMVYSYAQRFVMTLRENALVAAMPFIVISSLLIILLAAVPGLRILWFLLLILHSVGCLGDFMLIRYSYRNQDRLMYTYDDLDERRTYFFEEIPAEPTRMAVDRDKEKGAVLLQKQV